jgi:hypothetical protein
MVKKTEYFTGALTDATRDSHERVRFVRDLNPKP